MLAHLVALLVAVTPTQGPDPPPDTSTALTPTRYELDFRVDLANERLDADARVTAVNRSSRPVTAAAFLLYRLMRVTDARDGRGAALAFRQPVVEFLDHPTLQVRQVVVSLGRPLAPGDSTVVRLAYGGALLGYAETGMLYVRDRIDSAYSLLRQDAYAYPELVAPSHAINRRAGLATFDYHARVTVPDGFVVANGGELLGRASAGGGRTTFEFRNTRPAWRMDFAVAPFRVGERGAFRVYYLPEDSLGGARVLRAMVRATDLYTRWFGPLRGRPGFALIEIPDGWGSQADVSSILQAAAAFRDSTRQHELYHELSHLWNVDATDRPPPRWNEGLATFLEHLAADSLDGLATTDSVAQRLADWLRARASKEPRLREVAPRDYGRAEMTDYSYSVGGLMFYSLYRVMGHDAFARLIRDYYRDHAARGGGTDDFVALAKRLSPVPLDALFGDWLYSTRWTTALAETPAARDLPARYRKAVTGT